ncbi:MAG: hypothetical protein ONB31_02365 [candidate division KSB1 bacterium]|nr:hypothetical protein [candidate division KSB1 bacterium]MDZ7335551.1 hypothetical protein [candidate division KSB1 bacterium]MDZ7356917.1 hypothetical protein [candidate division KSB1 bacterium]MDZ7399252.1 hypothetical protein [candidate division KSB1 bacterium]
MKSRKAIVFLSTFLLIWSLISIQKETAQAQAMQNQKISVTVKPGAHWQHSFRILGLIKVTNQPQMAFWLEDSEGNYLTTLYVTYRTAVQDWRSSPGEKKGEIRRPSSLPVWVHQHQAGGLMDQSICARCHDLHKAKEKVIDPNSELATITGATPKAGFTREWQIPVDLKPGKYLIKAEINHSKDFNNAFKEAARENDQNYSGGKMGSGQPSVVWQGELQIGTKPSAVWLKKIGHGHPAGKDGTIFSDLSMLDSALDIVESIEVKCE